MTTLAEIREKLKAAELRGAGENKVGDKSVYPFWNLKEGTEAVIRFLPDANQDNTFFWVERQIIKLPFAGIKGDPENKLVTVQVPCNEMYGGTCPILTAVRPWFKSPDLEDMGRKYWKKRSYIFQGFVVADGLGEEEPPENPIRRFVLSPQVYQLVRSALVDPELEELPTDYVHGVDFRIKKGSKGGYADYSTSSWSRRERPLNDAELAAIEQFGLYNLADFLPKRPSDVELKVMEEMFEASVDGKPYDMEAWGNYFKPAGMNQNSGDPVKPAVQTTTSQVADSHVDDDPPFDVDPPAVKSTTTKTEPTASSDNRAQDILAMIRNRQKS